MGDLQLPSKRRSGMGEAILKDLKAGERYRQQQLKLARMDPRDEEFVRQLRILQTYFDRQDAPNYNGFSVGYSALLVWVGLSSWLLHASCGNHWGPFLDAYSMFMLMSFVLWHLIARERMWPFKWAVLAYLAWTLAWFPVYWFFVQFGDVFFGILLAVLLLNELRFLLQQTFVDRHRRIRRRLKERGCSCLAGFFFPKLLVQRFWRWFLAAVAGFLLSFLMWNVGLGPMDQGATFCVPVWWFQAHGIWHYGTALAAIFMFRYLQEERVYVHRADSALVSSRPGTCFRFKQRFTALIAP